VALTLTYGNPAVKNAAFCVEGDSLRAEGARESAQADRDYDGQRATNSVEVDVWGCFPGFVLFQVAACK
jgi:hypothetical protein